MELSRQRSVTQTGERYKKTKAMKARFIRPNPAVEADIKTAKLLANLRSFDTHEMSDMELAERIISGYSRNE